MKSNIDWFSNYIFFFISRQSRTRIVSKGSITRDNNVKKETIRQFVEDENADENNDDNFVHEKYSGQLNSQ